MTKRLLVVLGCLTFPLSRFPLPALSAQQRAMTIEDYLALPSVGDPQLSPDGKWVAYTVTHYSLKENRGTTRIWLELMWRHWDDWRAGKRQHLFLVSLADASARDLTPVDHDVPTIATSGDGDVAVAPDGKEIAVALHDDSTVADNTNVDIYLTTRDGGGGTGDGGWRQLTTAKGADTPPPYSPAGEWLPA